MRTFTKFRFSILALGFALLGAALPLHAAESKANAHYWWDAEAVVGQSTLTRSDDGLKASFKINAGATDNDRVLTLWFIVFNTPEGCFTSPCTPADLFNPEAAGDFLYGGGIITTDRKAQFGGSIAVDDPSGSGFVEFGVPAELVPGVTDPWGAEVMLAIHSHGPAGSGDFLKYQISSFLGGCDEFLGPDGFASGPQDVPDEEGECSTFIYSIHQP